MRQRTSLNLTAGVKSAWQPVQKDEMEHKIKTAWHTSVDSTLLTCCVQFQRALKMLVSFVRGVMMFLTGFVYICVYLKDKANPQLCHFPLDSLLPLYCDNNY